MMDYILGTIIHILDIGIMTVAILFVVESSCVLLLLRVLEETIAGNSYNQTINSTSRNGGLTGYGYCASRGPFGCCLPAKG